TEIQKQKRETRRVMNAIRVKDIPCLHLNSRKSKKQQLIALEKRLISMSIGRATLKNYQVYSPSYCWLIGFKVMNANSIISKQLKQLDKSRGRQIHHFKKS